VNCIVLHELNFSEQKAVTILVRFCSQYRDLHVIETIKMNAMIFPLYLDSDCYFFVP
jgi:hypothetical protein